MKRKSTIFIPIHPPEPKKQLTPRQLATAKDESVQNESGRKTEFGKKNDFDWQTQWMNFFESSRVEFNDKLSTEREKNRENQLLIKQLTQKIKTKDFLFAEMKANYVEKVATLTTKCNIQQTIQNRKAIAKLTAKQITCDKATQYDSGIGVADAAIQTTVEINDNMKQIIQYINDMPIELCTNTVEEKTEEIVLSADKAIETKNHRIQRSTTESATSQIATKQRTIGKKKVYMYMCDKCPYWTTKSSSLNDHRQEFCRSACKKKDMMCNICRKPFTYRGLRIHLNYFVKGKHRSDGEHSKYTPAQHKMFLDQHKCLKKK